MSAKVQISKDLLDGVRTLLEELHHVSLDEPTRILCKALEHEIGAKYEALERRRAFTEYKQAQAGTAERENNRQNYLTQSGIHKNWRSPEETSPSP